MPTPTYTSLATITLESSASSVTFSSIPATYRDLVLVASCQYASVGSMRVRLNGDAGANYAAVRTSGNGSSAQSDSYNTGGLTAAYLQFETYSANTQLVHVLQFMDYSATDKHKTFLARPNSAANATGMEAHRWASTAAVNTILLDVNGVNFNAGSTFNLYGIVS